MPMIDVYSASGTFADKHALARDLAAAVMRWEKVPELPLFQKNTAAFVHDLPADSLSNVDGDNNYVRVQVLTPIGRPGSREAAGRRPRTHRHRRRGRRRPDTGRAHLGAHHRVARRRMGDQRAREHGSTSRSRPSELAAWPTSERGK